MERDAHQPKQEQPGSRAVVIGSGIAGLAAASVLVKYYEKVCVIDRDALPDEKTIRPGIPQANHAHVLLPDGQIMLEELFPGIVDELLAGGAQAIDDSRDTLYYNGQEWRIPSKKIDQPSVACSRPMLESALHHRIIVYSQVQVMQGFEAVGLKTDETGSQVKSVTIQDRQAPNSPHQELAADLVIDASGRNSRTPRWLESLGYSPPEEWQINAHGGYASRFYRQPEDNGRAWKKLYIKPNPPDATRGGVILPLEDNRWHVTLIGLAGDYPPTDEAGFLAFARSLAVPQLYEAIQAAEPLNKIAGFRKNENRVRRYEILPRYLEGLLVLGDAVYTMNPVYTLGMTAALVSCQALEEEIRKWAKDPGGPGFSAAFQKLLAVRMSKLWHQAVNSDWRWPATDISDNTEELYPQPEMNSGE